MLIAVEVAKEAALAPGMACDATGLRHSVQHHVAIAVEAQLGDRLPVAAFLALAPQPAARAREVDRLPAGGGLGQRLGRKTLRTDDPTERNDSKVLETLIELAPGTTLPVGLRVDAFILATGR